MLNRRERKKEETKSNIIDCSLKLFKEKGFGETSMEEIAEKSDVSKGTLYNYFPDKESILVGYFQIIISEYGKEIKTSLSEHKDIKSRLYNLLDFIKEIFGDDPELASVYFKYRMQKLFDNNPFDSPMRSGLENSVIELIKEAQSSGELRSDFPAVVIARNLEFLIMSFFVVNIYNQEPFEIDSVKSQLVELFLNGSKQ